MNLRAPLLALALAAGALLSTPAPAAAKAHRVVFDLAVDDLTTWAVLQKNVASLKEAFGKEPVEVEVVAYGKGLDLLRGGDSAVAQGLDALVKQGVHFAVCGITAKADKLGAADLHPGCSLVDGGLAELVRRQEEGWAYIKLAPYGGRP